MACLAAGNVLPGLSQSRKLSSPIRSPASGTLNGCWGRCGLLPGLLPGLLDVGVGVSGGRVGRLKALADVKLEESEAPVVEEEATIAPSKVDYNWETEWYPMYLQKEVPKDAPLGLTVFDRSLVLFYDGQGSLHCLEDRCPHRAAKLSEGQIADGRLECLYHGWQFEGDGSCSRIPQLPAGAKIPRAACARSYAIKDSQGVIWVWLGEKETADHGRIPWFENYAREGFEDISTIHELPYDYSILLENLMDPAHVPISHDRTDFSAKREDAQALQFEVTERTARGFAGKWGLSKDGKLGTSTRFEAPCVLRNEKQVPSKDGSTIYYSALFLCRPAGQGKSMLIARFGSSGVGMAAFRKLFPLWLMHSVANSVFEQDMGFLASQNEFMVRKGVGTKDIYLSLKSCDTWVLELRKWMEMVGHGMPYYIGHQTASPPPLGAVLEHAPVGTVAATASSYPPKGSFGHLYARDMTNRYFRHVIHCKECRSTLANFKKYQEVSLVGGVVSGSVAILVGSSQWQIFLVALALGLFATSWACSKAQDFFTVNFVRKHRK